MKLLIACFAGKNNGAYHIIQKMNNSCDKLSLLNDKEKSCMQLNNAMSKSIYAKIMILGQKPLLKNKYCIETKGRCFYSQIETHYKYEELVKVFEENNILYNISDNAGTSYCNNIYYWALGHLNDKEILFLHTPYLKNIISVEKMAIAIDNYVVAYNYV